MMMVEMHSVADLVFGNAAGNAAGNGNNDCDGNNGGILMRPG